jgi:hypothetical protein
MDRHSSSVKTNRALIPLPSEAHLHAADFVLTLEKPSCVPAAVYDGAGERLLLHKAGNRVVLARFDAAQGRLRAVAALGDINAMRASVK